MTNDRMFTNSPPNPDAHTAMAYIEGLAERVASAANEASLPSERTHTSLIQHEPMGTADDKFTANFRGERSQDSADIVAKMVKTTGMVKDSTIEPDGETTRRVSFVVAKEDRENLINEIRNMNEDLTDDVTASTLKRNIVTALKTRDKLNEKLSDSKASIEFVKPRDHMGAAVDVELKLRTSNVELYDEIKDKSGIISNSTSEKWTDNAGKEHPIALDIHVTGAKQMDAIAREVDNFLKKQTAVMSHG